MKILVVFLGILCFLISAYPCCIDDDCDSVSVEKIAEKQNEKETEDRGLCSPFIGCGSCIGFISNNEKPLTTFQVLSIVSPKIFGLQFKSVETEYIDKLWQPPKQVIIS